MGTGNDDSDCIQKLLSQCLYIALKAMAAVHNGKCTKQMPYYFWVVCIRLMIENGKIIKVQMFILTYVLKTKINLVDIT
jgi:hypothetical protein